jgi:hypothetical protein
MALERRAYTGPSSQYRTRVRDASTSRQVAAVSLEVWGVSLDGAAAGADLGGSSKYSNENFED